MWTLQGAHLASKQRWWQWKLQHTHGHARGATLQWAPPSALIYAWAAMRSHRWAASTRHAAPPRDLVLFVQTLHEPIRFNSISMIEKIEMYPPVPQIDHTISLLFFDRTLVKLVISRFDMWVDHWTQINQTATPKIKHDGPQTFQFPFFCLSKGVFDT